MLLSQFPKFKHYSNKETLKITKDTFLSDPASDLSPAYLPGYYNVSNSLKLCELNGNLVITFVNPETNKQTFQIFGNRQINNSILAVFKYQSANGYEQIIEELNESQYKRITAADIHTERAKDCDDYILSTQDHRDLTHPKLKAEARAVRHFIRKYGDDIKIFELDLTNHESISLIINAWHSWKQYFKSTNNDPDAIERKYISMYLMHADELPTKNFIISHANQIIAFAIYDINEKQNCVILHTLKVDYAYNHVFDFGLHAIASRLYSEGFRLLNIEEDLGITGLRNKKNRLLPIKKIQKYRAYPTR